MKKSHFLLITLFIMSFVAAAQKTDEKEINSKITDVTVFLEGSQIYRKAETQVNSGKSILVFKNLSPYIDINSIQVKGEGTFTILSVNHQSNFLEPGVESAEVIALREKIKDLNDKKDMEQSQILLLEKKQLLIDANKVFTNNQQTINPETLNQLTNIYMKNAGEISMGILDHKKKIREIEKETAKLSSQIEEKSVVKNESSGEILVTVESKSQVTAQFFISYYTSDAFWFPSYDIRVNSVDEPIALVYKSNLQQNTGENWNEVKLTFSNGTPGKSGTLPIIKPYYLSFNYPVYRETYRDAMKSASPALSQQNEATGSRVDPYETMLTEPLLIQEQSNTTTFEFVINSLYTINTGSKITTIDMKTIEIPAIYEYHTIPKLDKAAYLVASISGWSEYNLLSGESNIYFEKTYVGKSLIDIRNLEDTLHISLGPDKNIVVTREKIKDYNTRKFLGSNQVVSRAYKIGLRNNRGNSVKIIVHDQVPVSSNNEIWVEHDELSGASVNTESGEVIWKLTIDPKDQKELNLKYTVKFPKEKSLIID